MRVIAGKYKGRKLRGPLGMDIRPTGDRLKETLFNILGPAVEDAVVLDAFGGTGAIGLEALSRGARAVVFIESTAEGQRLIRQNLDRCGVQAGYRILPQDIFKALRSLSREEFKADIVFLDPPYGWKPYGDLVETIYAGQLVSASGRVVIEHHRKADLPESGRGFRRMRLVKQGDHCLSFYEPRSSSSPAPEERLASAPEVQSPSGEGTDEIPS